jgi:hypothetical protein
MMTLCSRGGSSAALAAALALASPILPAAAQEMPTFQPDDPAAAPEVRLPRTAPSGGPARAEIFRAERPGRAERPARPRTEPIAAPQPAYSPPAYSPPARIDPDVEAVADLADRAGGDRRGGRAGGGFGGQVRASGPAAEPAPAPGADRQGTRGGWRGGEVRDDGDIWRGQRGQDRSRTWQRDRTQAPVFERQQQEWQSRRRDQSVIGQSTVTTTDRGTGRGTDWQQGRRDGWGDTPRDETRRDGWQDRGRSDWRGGNRSDWRSNHWRADRRDDWRADRRDDWRRGDRRNWRHDDWRWGWNGRPGWDNRDFRRWDNRWRSNRAYDWNLYRRANRFIFHPGPYFAPYRSHRYSPLSIGFYLDSLFFQPRFFINNPWSYRLPPAYGPYQWVRYYDDVVLVDIYTGEVVDVLYNFFW